MRKIAFLSTLCLMFIATSCIDGLKSITGSGNVVVQNRNVGNFTEIDAESGMDVTVEQANVTSVEVHADDNIQEHIITRVEGNTLVITSEFGNFNNATRNIRIKVPKIEAMKISSGVSLNTTGVIKGESIKVETSSGSTMVAELEYDEVDGESSSGSTMSLSGKSLDADLSSSSGSTIDASRLMANEVRAKASSGSSVSVKPILKLDGKASSGGSVTYSGSPKEVKRNESSGGSVSGS